MPFFPRDFDRIAHHCGTDKGEPGHRYGAIYAPIVQTLRHEPDLRILEIGIGAGHSMKLWHNLFPKAQVTGLDNDPRCADFVKPPDQLYIGGQTDTLILDDILNNRGPFTLIVDDASHVPADQIATFKLLWPTLRRPAWYIIEDIQLYPEDDPTAARFFTGAANHLMLLPIGQHPYTATFGTHIAAFHRPIQA